MKLLVRADGDGTMGAGHVLRCLAVAQAWMGRGGTVAWAAAALSPGLADRLAAEGLAVHALAAATDPALLRALAEAERPEVLLVDGYHLGGDHLARLVGATPRLAVIDDDGRLAGPAPDVLINPNVDAAERDYATLRPTAQRLCGPDFALLRAEFTSPAPTPAVWPPRRVLVTLGGADARGLGPTVATAAAARWPAAEVRLLQGPAAPPPPPLAAGITALPPTDRMAEELARADLVLAAAGGTTWEVCHLGRPALLLIAADNQAGLAGWLAGRDLALVVDARRGDWHTSLEEALADLDATPAVETARAAARAQLIDGQGAGRVAEALMSRAALHIGGK
ncbi:PseG/SpsG family protein [Roseospirillum parvum]|uniref:Spore coat polysaccharide biosynthesis protein SpsG, predicted glycosyltransferase n=1 Tax=Roseospirillum parvum TaxID=83401 RepID=A0A1G8A353_9PROT|nr:hypothetical protein [Roseospirillum parvum]SDH15348.1 Spore coat polysaccharide biosynthesis protein SpsG, predicted glycosyltransferase [Roseospirillum parvum]